MRLNRLILGAAAASLTAIALLLGGVLHDSSSATAPPVAVSPAAASARYETGVSAGATTTEQTVAKLQATLRANPDDVQSLDALGLAYQQRARETGDPVYYTKSGQVLQHVLTLVPRDLVATSGLGALALSRHRFSEALVLGRRARAISPTTALTYGVIGDALVELGRYPAAFQAFDTMVTMRPSLSSYARVSHGLELLGRVPEAIAAMKLAVDASLGQGEAEAWTRVQLSKIYWANGKIDLAGRQDRAALRAFPDYHYALDALSRVEYAEGNYRSAIALEQEAVNRIPLPQYVAQLGDLLYVTGQNSRANRQYATISVINRLLNANGVRTDLEIAMFDVDHRIGLPHALALARIAHRDRPSIDGDDVLAWALARTGRCGQALPYANHALRLGTHDSLKLFHRGWIEQCLGQRAAARRDFAHALGLNPHFSILWAPVARRALR